MRSLLIPVLIPLAAFAAPKEVPLPEPFATPSVRNAPKVISRPSGIELRVPAGFAVEE